MKYYCNRRVPNQNKPKQYDGASGIQQPVQNEICCCPPSACENNEEIILPPVSESDSKYGFTADVIESPEGQGGAYSQCGGYNKQTTEMYAPDVCSEANISDSVFFDNMSGKFDLISIPHEHNGISIKSMTNYLDRYVGKYICLDLWTSECRREEVCGTLVETGKDFLVVNSYKTDKLTLIDLKAIRYINIFCR